MDRRIQKTKEAIQRAYFALVIEKNTSKVTITDIAKKANIDRKTFYLHYESTNDIIYEVAKNRFEELRKNLDDSNFFSYPLDTSAFFNSINHSIQSNIEFHQHLASHPDSGYFWNSVKEIMIETICDVMTNKVAMSKNKLQIFARFIASGITDVYSSWLRNELPVSLDELGAITGDIIHNGIRQLSLQAEI